jgi:hypothetical protein
LEATAATMASDAGGRVVPPVTGAGGGWCTGTTSSVEGVS